MGDTGASKGMIWLKLFSKNHLGCIVDNGVDQGRQEQDRRNR